MGTALLREVLESPPGTKYVALYCPGTTLAVYHHLIEYPLDHRKKPAPARLNVAHGRSISMTDQTQRQPKGGACFMTAR